MHDPKSPTWPYVLAFAEAMEAKLAVNRHKGNRADWLRCGVEYLLRRATAERRELSRAIKDDAGACAIASEAADVANFMMFVADASGGLIVEPEERR